jgi:ribonuclease HI
MRYYVITNENTAGIYTSWKIVENMINENPGTVVKIFSSYKEAKTLLEKNQSMKFPIVNKQRSNQGKEIAILINNTVYIDGSYANKTNVAGFGIVITTTNKDKITAYGKVPLSLSDNVAELYAIYVALSLIKEPLTIYTQSNGIINIMNRHIYEWERTNWEGLENKIIYQNIFNLMKGRDVVVRTGSDIESKKLAEQGKYCSLSLIVAINGSIQPQKKFIYENDTKSIDSESAGKHA